jgi:serine/threonine-protein phosphatase PGAM5
VVDSSEARGSRAAVFLAVSLLGAGSVVSAPAAEADEAPRTLYLIRHGQYDHGDERPPDVGKGLVPLGVAQSRLLASRLRAIPVTMGSLFSSTFTRAHETAKIIAEEFPPLEVQATPLLCECTPPTRRADVMEELEPGEADSCRARLEEAFSSFFVPSQDGERHDIVVCHGNVIRYFITRVLGVDPEAWLGMTLGNCSLTIVRIRPGGAMSLLAAGDVGHLPPNLQSGLSSEAKPLEAPAD